MKKLILILLGSLSFFSCTSFKVTRITESNRDSISGLRFFLPRPYLLVAEKDLLVDGVKTVKECETETTTMTEKMAVARKELLCTVIYLPDPQKEYAISTFSGKVPKSIKLEDGWRLSGINLPGMNSARDNKAGLLSGTEGLSPGVYALDYQKGQTLLRKLKIIQ